MDQGSISLFTARGKEFCVLHFRMKELPNRDICVHIHGRIEDARKGKCAAGQIWKVTEGLPGILRKRKKNYVDIKYRCIFDRDNLYYR